MRFTDFVAETNPQDSPESVLALMGRAANDPVVAALLSPRERKCLQWIALGKTLWDTGMILNISENTVNYHVRNACKKLDTNSRTFAVVKAIRYGLISTASR